MKTRRILLQLVVFWLAPVLGLAHDDKYSRESLRGLRGVQVVVEDLRPEVEQAGLTKAMIRTDESAR